MSLVRRRASLSKALLMFWANFDNTNNKWYVYICNAVLSNLYESFSRILATPPSSELCHSQNLKKIDFLPSFCVGLTSAGVSAMEAEEHNKKQGVRLV